MRARTVVLLLALGAPLPTQTHAAWLDSPGGALRFGLLLPEEGEAYLVNGEERIAIEARRDGDAVRLSFPPYDSWIEAQRSDDGGLRGTWTKRRGRAHTTELAFSATPLAAAASPEVTEAAQPLAGRWRVRFAADEHDAVGVFEASDGGLRGTFLTTLGDYRYLAGHATATGLELSCFDGAHAFLFRAELQPDGTLRGDFWSSDTWHETWTAARDDDAALPDAFALTTAAEPDQLAGLVYPDVDGRRLPLRQLLGENGTLLYLFGSWCPNCNDAGALLAELAERHRARGVRVVGLAFEHDDDEAARRARVRAYLARRALPFPVLLAGPADKAAASRAFPVLDRIRAYPTTVFVGADGRVRAVHTGFSGPATGPAHARMRQRFEQVVQQLGT